MEVQIPTMVSHFNDSLTNTHDNFYQPMRDDLQQRVMQNSYARALVNMMAQKYINQRLNSTLIAAFVCIMNSYCDDSAQNAYYISLVEESVRIGRFDPVTLIIAVIYLDRAIEKGVQVNVENKRQLMFTTLLLARKFAQDRPIANSALSDIWRFSPRLINAMEFKLLQILEFDVYVSYDDIISTIITKF